LSELNKMNNHLFPTCAGKKYKAQSLVYLPFLFFLNKSNPTIIPSSFS